jgi:hypothetical protein
MAYSSTRLAIRRARSLLSIVAALAATTLLLTGPVGCSDPSIERQAKFEKELGAIAAECSNLLGTKVDLLSSNPTDESLAALRAVADKAKGLSAGSPTQEAAARSLAASISRTSGVLALSRATSIEAAHEEKRALALAADSLANDLDAVAEAAGNLDLDDSRAAAQGLKSEAPESARRLQSAVAKFESPLNAASSRMSEAAARLSALDQENAVLLRKARESNPEVALTFVEEAAKVQAEARATRTSMSNNGIDAAELSSKKALEESNLGAAQNLQSAATAALDLLGQFEGDVRSSAQKTAEMAKTLRAQTEELLKSIVDERAGALRAAYDAAAADFANGSSGGSPSTIALSDELRLQIRELEGLGAHGRALLALKGENAAGLADAKAAAETLIASIKEKSTAAVDQLANAGEEASAFPARAFFDEVKKMADGLSVDKLMTPPALVERPKAVAKKAGGASGRSMSGDGGAAGGIADLDAWVKQMNELTANGEFETVMDAIVGAADDSTETGRAMSNLTKRLMRASLPLQKALHAKFGKSTLDVADMPGGNFGVGMMVVKSNNGEIASVGGVGTEQIVFRKIGGVWKIDYVEALRRSGVSDEQLEAMGPAMAMMGETMAASMERAMQEVAAAVEAGQFATLEEVSKAIVGKMADAIGGLGGGGGRGRGF